ncbi:MAG: C13 family peptidase [Azoarcus sp.]|jgi:hypothetical protein|nr:C13 family peptidase [Azoarcus sp.]
MPESDLHARSSLAADLRQLGHILLLRRTPPGGLGPDVSKLPALVMLYCLFALGLGIALNGWDDGKIVLVPTLLAPFAAVAVIAGVLKWIDRRLDAGRLWLAFSLLLTMLPAAAFIAAQAWPVLMERDHFAGHPMFAGVLPRCIATLPHLWLALAGACFAARVPHGSDWRRGLYAPLSAIALVVIFTATDPLSIWQFHESPTEHPAKAPVFAPGEDVLYGQPRLLDERLAALEAGQPGQPEIFFLGVAGSEEGVFMREAIAVEQLFKDRYATAGRSLILVNNPATAREHPFANGETLTRALRRIGERMNGEEDLLFLFFTSHGTSDWRFSISLRPFAFPDFTPQMLRDALDAAGIARKVIVISSCYSGGFIPALADASTLVITAAAADRNSFGCSNDNDLTDFGLAYFGEALRETRSFTEAFERARAAIARRETAEGIPPSLPQIAGGEALRAQLDGFARARTDTPAAVPCRRTANPC